MASNEEAAAAAACSHEEDDLKASENYQAPAKKTLEEIIRQDTEDESLRKYKEALLGKAAQQALTPCKLMSTHGLNYYFRRSRHVSY